MKISSVDIFTYNLPLKYPLKIGITPITDRQGAIVCIKTDDDLVGYGEAAPLDGLHSESLHDIIIQLKKIAPKLLEITYSNVFETVTELQKYENWHPTVQFAIESALFTIDESSKDHAGKTSLLPPVNRTILINSLIWGGGTSIKDNVLSSLQNNFRAIKIKVGRQPIEEEIKLITAVQQLIRQKAMLRLDANRKWTFEEAVTFFKSIDGDSVEYIEEPLNDPAKLPELYKKTGIPIALDESVVDSSIENFQTANWITAIILKPAVLGSLQKMLHYLDVAKKQNIKTVISDTFHSGIGLSFLVRLASIIKEQIPMGLDTYSWLDDDILTERLAVENGHFDLKQVMDICRNVDYSKLQRIE